jgi:hypothetical protein
LAFSSLDLVPVTVRRILLVVGYALAILVVGAIVLGTLFPDFLMYLLIPFVGD